MRRGLAAGLVASSNYVLNEILDAKYDRLHPVKKNRPVPSGDIIIASIHWGNNWVKAIPSAHRLLAHFLIDHGEINVIHGHSSHHPLGIEVYKGKPILYGCGDFLTDYEGISGHEEFRDDLGLMYFASVDPSTGKLVQLQMAPTQMKNFSLQRVSRADALWLRDTLNREGKIFGTRVELNKEKNLTLQWD